MVRHIKCELRGAAWAEHPEHRWLTGWKANLILTLEVFHNGGQESDASLVVPLNPGTFTLGLGTGLSGQTTRTERVYFNESLDKLNSNTDLDCAHDETTASHQDLLAGTLGFLDLFNRALEAQKLADIKPNQLDYNLDFVIKMNASIGPRWSLIPVGNDRTLSAGFRLLGSKSNTDSLKVTFSRDQPSCYVELVDGKCPTPVYIVGDAKGKGALRAFKAPTAVIPDDGNAITRNLLQGIDDKLRREGLGN